MPFLHCKNKLKRAQNVQNSEFAYYASKSGKWIKQTPTPPFWGDVGVKKWSQILDSGTRSPIFGHLKMGTFAKSAQFQCKKGIFYKMVARRGKCPKNQFFRIFGLLSYRYNLHQVRLEFRQLFDILVHPSAHPQKSFGFPALGLTQRQNSDIVGELNSLKCS